MSQLYPAVRKFPGFGTNNRQSVITTSGQDITTSGQDITTSGDNTGSDLASPENFLQNNH